MTFSPHPCAEFPNDNPDLHDGATWVCSWTRARPRALVSARGVARNLAEAASPTVVHSPPDTSTQVAEYVVSTRREEQVTAATENAVVQPEAAEARSAEQADVTVEFTPLPAVVEPIIQPEPSTPLEPGEPMTDNDAQETTADANAQRELEPLTLEPSTPPGAVTWHDPWDAVVRELLEEDAHPAPEVRAPARESGVSAINRTQKARPASAPRARSAAANAPAPRPSEAVEEARASTDPFVAELQELVSVPPPPEAMPARTEADIPARADDVASLKEQSEPAPAPLSLQELAARVSPPPPEVAEVEAPRAAEHSEAFATYPARDTELAEEGAAPTLLAPFDAAESKRPSFLVPRPESVMSPLSAVAAEVEPIDIDLTPNPPGIGGWVELTELVERFLLERGATRAAAISCRLLQGQGAELNTLSARVADRLVAANIAERRGQTIQPTASFIQQAKEHQADYANGQANIERTLEWITEVVRCLLASEASDDVIQAQLEQAGLVGLLLKAA